MAATQRQTSETASSNMPAQSSGNHSPPKSAFARHPSKTRPRGPRQQSPLLPMPHKKKFVSFDNTDEVIQYDMPTPEPDTSPLLDEDSEEEVRSPCQRPLPQLPESVREPDIASLTKIEKECRDAPYPASPSLATRIEEDRLPINSRIDAVLSSTPSQFTPTHRPRETGEWGSQSSLMGCNPKSPLMIDENDPDETEFIFENLPNVQRKESLLDSQRQAATDHIQLQRATSNPFRKQKSNPELERSYSQRKKTLKKLLSSRPVQVPISIQEEVDPEIQAFDFESTQDQAPSKKPSTPETDYTITRPLSFSKVFSPYPAESSEVSRSSQVILDELDAELRAVSSASDDLIDAEPVDSWEGSLEDKPESLDVQRSLPAHDPHVSLPPSVPFNFEELPLSEQMLVSEYSTPASQSLQKLSYYTGNPGSMEKGQNVQRSPVGGDHEIAEHLCTVPESAPTPPAPVSPSQAQSPREPSSYQVSGLSATSGIEQRSHISSPKVASPTTPRQPQGSSLPQQAGLAQSPNSTAMPPVSPHINSPRAVANEPRSPQMMDEPTCMVTNQQESPRGEPLEASQPHFSTNESSSPHIVNPPKAEIPKSPQVAASPKQPLVESPLLQSLNQESPSLQSAIPMSPAPLENRPELRFNGSLEKLRNYESSPFFMKISPNPSIESPEIAVMQKRSPPASLELDSELSESEDPRLEDANRELELLLNYTRKGVPLTSSSDNFGDTSELSAVENGKLTGGKSSSIPDSEKLSRLPCLPAISQLSLNLDEGIGGSLSDGLDKFITRSTSYVVREREEHVQARSTFSFRSNASTNHIEPRGMTPGSSRTFDEAESLNRTTSKSIASERDSIRLATIQTINQVGRREPSAHQSMDPGVTLRHSSSRYEPRKFSHLSEAPNFSSESDEHVPRLIEISQGPETMAEQIIDAPALSSEKSTPSVAHTPKLPESDPMKRYNELHRNGPPATVANERGRLFLQVQGVSHIALPGAGLENATVQVTLDNSVHEITTPEAPLTTNVTLNYEYEMAVIDKLTIVCTLRAAWVPTISKEEETLAATYKTSRAQKRSSLVQMFRRLSVRAPSLQPSKEGSGLLAPGSSDNWSQFVASDGTFGRAFINVDELRHECFGKPQILELPCHNEYVPVGSPASLSMLRLKVLFIPRLSRAEVLPPTMADALDVIKAAKRAQHVVASGIMAQLGGDCLKWKRRYFVLDQNVLVSYNIESKDPRATINLRKVIGIKNDDESSFRLIFKNGKHIEFSLEHAKQRDNWVASMGHLLAEPPSTCSPWTSLVLYGTREAFIRYSQNRFQAEESQMRTEPRRHTKRISEPILDAHDTPYQV